MTVTIIQNQLWKLFQEDYLRSVLLSLTPQTILFCTSSEILKFQCNDFFGNSSTTLIPPSYFYSTIRDNFYVIHVLNYKLEMTLLPLSNIGNCSIIFFPISSSSFRIYNNIYHCFLWKFDLGSVAIVFLLQADIPTVYVRVFFLRACNWLYFIVRYFLTFAYFWIHYSFALEKKIK